MALMKRLQTRSFNAYLNRLRGGHTAAATAATSSAAALVAGLTDAHAHQQQCKYRTRA
jgi:hypothetical protein